MEWNEKKKYVLKKNIKHLLLTVDDINAKLNRIDEGDNDETSV